MDIFHLRLMKSADQDAKLLKLVEIVKRMLRDGFRPIVWCRYLATAAFAPGRSSGMQISLFDVGDCADAEVDKLHARWRRDAEEEKESRTRFAQRSIKPEEVERDELRAADAILSSPDEVRDFVLTACGRLNVGIKAAGVGRWQLNLGMLPPVVRQRLGARPDPWPITFESPTPKGLAYISRNHPLVESLAEYLIDVAFHPTRGDQPVVRGGVIRTAQVQQRTTLLLLRPRYLVYEAGEERPGLAEKTLVWGFISAPPEIAPLAPAEARSLLVMATAAANIVPEQQQAALQLAVEQWETLCGDTRSGAARPALALQELLDGRVADLQESHSRIRRLLRQARTRITPQLPPDLLGVVALLPVPRSV